MNMSNIYGLTLVLHESHSDVAPFTSFILLPLIFYDKSLDFPMYTIPGLLTTTMTLKSIHFDY